MNTAQPALGPHPQRAPGDRRAWPRSTKKIRVLLLVEDSALDEPYGGWILDTSRGGVRLLLGKEAFPTGTLLRMRAPFASDRAPWTLVRVKNTRQKDNIWEVGCEFVQTVAVQPTPRMVG